MQAGPSSQSRRFSVLELQRILDIAPHFIDKSKKNIFVLTAGSSLPVLQELLQNEDLWNNDDPIAAFRHAIMQHEAMIPSFSVQSDKLRESLAHANLMSPRNGTTEVYKQIEVEIEDLKQRLVPIGDFEWAVVCKLSMQFSDLLPKTHEGRAAIQGLIEQLQLIHKITNSDTFKEGAAFLRCDLSYLQDVFIETITKICASGFVGSAHAIHRYMSLAPWVLSESERNEVDSTKIAMTLAPGLFQGLGIFGQIIPRTGDELHNMQADTREYALFKKVMMELIAAPHFQKPFDVSLYLGTVPVAVAPTSKDKKAHESSPSSSTSRHVSLLDKFRNMSITSSSSSSSSSSTVPTRTVERKSSYPASKVDKGHVVARTTSEPGTPLLPGYGLIRAVGSSPSSPRLSSSSRTGAPTTTVTTPVDLSDGNKPKESGNLNLR